MKRYFSLVLLGSISQSLPATISLEGYINGQWLSFTASGDSWDPPFQNPGGEYHENLSYANPTGILSQEVDLTGYDWLPSYSRIYDAATSFSGGSTIVYAVSYTAYDTLNKSLWSHEIRLTGMSTSSICFECLIGSDNTFEYSELIATRSNYDPRNGMDGELLFKRITGYLTLKEYSAITIPEPGASILFGLGLFLMLLIKKSKRTEM
jgi:hypothetical protein